MHKILQAILQQYMNWELPMLKLDLEKAEEPEMKVPTSVGSLKKHESFRKTSTSALTMLKPFIVDHEKLWKILQEVEIPANLTVS